MSNFGAYAKYYDLIYREKDYRAEAEYVTSSLRSITGEAKSLLELGCGTGRHAIELAKLGWSVSGIDISPNMIAIAQRRRELSPEGIRQRLEFEQGDVRSYCGSTKFDAVAACFHVINYQVSDEDLRRTFATAARHLATGGTFLFDFWYGPAVMVDPPTLRIRRVRDAELEVVRITEPITHLEQHRVDVHFDIFMADLKNGSISRIQELHPMRYLFEPELHDLANGAGFEITKCEPWRAPGKVLTDQTWYGCIVCRRRGENSR